MTTERPKTVIIKGQRFTTKQGLEDNVHAMRDVAQELIEAADFQLTCLPKVLRVVQQFELSTVKAYGHNEGLGDGCWTKIVGAVGIDEERHDDGRVEIIEV